MQASETFYQIALTLINGIGSVQAKLLLEYFGNAENIFKAKKKDLAIVEGIGEVKAKAIKEFDNFIEAEEEIKFCNNHHINILSFTNENYPQRLKHCYDAPSVLYYRGNADLNNSKIIAVIGTRTNSDYGKQVTENLIEQLQQHNVTIISGLAFGIDAIAHKAAVKNNLSTVGVLAHGLQTIYPTQHKSLAKEILLNGGLLTEFNRNTKADKHNFPRRNRIVAGMSDATVVIETAVKGGSMITAELAYNYNRDVFAVPAKISDTKSGGCLKLIQQNKAIIYTSPEALLNELGWQQNNQSKKKIQKELFIDLSEDEKIIVNLLKEKDQLHIDELYLKSNLSSSSVASAILNLELSNVIVGLPGKIYKLN
ncbi:MAG: DNA-protecting protein DprA [Chitinophaga sp.]|jgi:DNA processing protein|nr:DNA-protecting protein DprA [Chitinophaga sp.]